METSSEEEFSNTPPEIAEIANSATCRLIPEKSKFHYERAYKEFKKWCGEKKAVKVSENILLAYLEEKSQRVKASTLWAIYSMLKCTLLIKENIEVRKFCRLIPYLKNKSIGYRPKKSKILTREEINKFMLEADNNTYLLTKVVLIMGISGACRREELTRMTIDDIEDKGSVLVVKIPDTKTYTERSQINSRKYPVIVFLHGESFEWNSGNPYDGSVLAALGQVIVVTLNFRLGILGFLKVEPGETSHQSNLGLVDQVAALLWIKANIDAFGGNPQSVTLLGHGTGAVCASLLTISPMAIHENELLFHRAILMSGTALSDWALVSKPLDVSIQVAQKLNCQPFNDFATCLRRKRLEELKEAASISEPYKTMFGPVVDNIVVPNDPRKSMKQYTGIFKSFELMYGVTELESIHLPLGGDRALIDGMLESERDEELEKYMRTRCEMKPEACVAATRAKYNYNMHTGVLGAGGQKPDRATIARDELLDILSDARTVAPVIQTGLYHSALNFQSFFYVFSHKTHSRKYIRNKSYNGDELPYVFGVPIGGPKFHFEDISYTENEKRLSMTIMWYISHFAYTGNPNMPKTSYSDLDYGRWHQFDKEWMQFDQTEQNYIKLDIPITNEQFYRKEQAEYWNELFPRSAESPLPWDLYPNPRKEDFNYTVYPTTVQWPFKVSNMPDVIRDGSPFDPFVTERTEESKQSSSTISILIIVGVVFLLANLAFFSMLYFKCIRNKKNSSRVVEISPADESNQEELYEKGNKKGFLSNCNIVKILHKNQQEDEDHYDAVHVDNSQLNPKLTRALSNSTIDAHAKVREWIANEIISKYSPKDDRKRKRDKNKMKDVHAPIQVPVEIDSSLDKCPTRPVSPTEQVPNVAKPLLIKTASIDRSNRRKRADKVSVAIDATPSGRGPSVLMQQPVELTKSFDYSKVSPTPLRRSVTMEDFSQYNETKTKNDLKKSVTSIDLKSIETEPTIIKIAHGHSKSDPVQNVDYYAVKCLKTFGPSCDVNVTSRDEIDVVAPPLSPEEALMTIKRRNFPKVLPDHPGREAFLNKRRSMPAHNTYIPILECQEYSNSEPYSPTGRSFMRFPPDPPPRTVTLGRQGSNPQPVCLSEPTLVEEQSSSPEPEVACNNLYIGPLIPRNKTNSKDKLDRTKEGNKQAPIKTEARAIPRAIITTNPNNPIKRLDPKVVVRPTINRNKSDDKTGNKYIPRVVVPDNRPELHAKPEISNCNKNTSIETKIDKTDETSDLRYLKGKKSHIPTLIKSSNTSLNRDPSSSESNSPSSSNSDTGTVVKRL